MFTDIIRIVRYYDNKYPVVRHRVEKVKNEKKANNNKPKEREYEVGNRIYIA